MAYILTYARSCIAIIFLLAAMGKIRTRTSFYSFTVWLGTITFTWIRGRLAILAALVFITGELAIVGLLLFPDTVVLGLLLATVFLTLATLRIAVLGARHALARCHCFGNQGDDLGVAHLLRDLVFLSVALLGISAHSTTPYHESYFSLAYCGVAGAITALLLAYYSTDLFHLLRALLPRERAQF